MGAEGYLEGVIQGVDTPADDDHGSSDENLRERMLKVIADRDVRSSRLQRERKAGKDMGAPVKAFEDKKAQSARLLQLALAPSSSNAIPSMEIQVQGLDIFSSLRLMGC